MTREDRRRNRASVLKALKSETGSSGGDAAAKRVAAYFKDPLKASTADFAFVGTLNLTRFYIDPQKPNATERRSLWQAMIAEFDQGTGADPGNWSGVTTVSQLQGIVEEALGLEEE
jgi:hypothetical protein